MLKSIVILTCMIAYCSAGLVGSKHHVRLKSRQDRNVPLADADDTQKEDTPKLHTPKLNLPSNSTSIRADIKEGFSCENRVYGYYADMENDCQIFHVCMPVTYGDGKERFFRWSFICPEETIFSQDSFTCMHRQDMLIDCRESIHYYELNRNFGTVNEEPIRHSPLKYHNDEKTEVETSTLKLEAEKISEPAAVTETVVDIVTSTPIKPIKIYKLNRRKPTHSPAYQKITENTTTKVVVKNTTQNLLKNPTSISTMKKNKPQLHMVKKPIIAAIKSNTKPKVTKTRPKIQVPLLNALPEKKNKTEEVQMPEDSMITQIQNIKDSVPITQAAILPVASDQSHTQATTVVPLTTAVQDEAAVDSQVPNLPDVMTTEEQTFLKQSVGGFENVDPTMAAEAEALINDFLQTMLKAENPPADAVAPIINSEATDLSNEEQNAKDTKVTEYDSQTNAQQNEETGVPLEKLFKETTKDTAEENAQSVQSSQVAAQILQIPVAILQESIADPQPVTQKLEDTKIKPELDTYQPMSIDHVVASVKEQLHQASASPAAVDVPEHIVEESAEPIIVPIYHRGSGIQSEVEHINDSAQAEVLKQDPLQIAEKPETE